MFVVVYGKSDIKETDLRSEVFLFWKDGGVWNHWKDSKVERKWWNVNSRKVRTGCLHVYICT